MSATPTDWAIATLPTPALAFDNAFVTQLPGDPDLTMRRRQVQTAYAHAKPWPVKAPHLLAYSSEMAEALGLSPDFIQSQAFADVFGGNALLTGMVPYAAAYGGHQFGQWAGQLGDGRAISLGEIVTPTRNRYELQLKGAGPTPFSRGADGRAVLRSSVREFLCSEAMHHLGVPTTRALSLVMTGDEVVRDMFYDGHAAPEPGAIVCRVSPSFIRFGTFELPASRGDETLLQKLVDFTIQRDFPDLAEEPDPTLRYAAFFNEVCRRTAIMIAHWQRVGFVHGVMNTDNMSILGLTLDYGPYGWMDDYDPNWTPNTSDSSHRRYRFGMQSDIAAWNLVCLANALRTLFASETPLREGLGHYVDTFTATDRDFTASKLGFAAFEEETDGPLVADLLTLMQQAEVDMTLFFRHLAQVDPATPSLAPLEAAFYDPDKRAEHEGPLLAWLARYASRVKQDNQAPETRISRMNRANPKYVLRNYMAQEAIDLAEQGDTRRITALLDLLRRPYDEQPGCELFAAKRPAWAKSQAGCSRLSCSS